MSGSAYLLRRAARDLRAQVATTRERPGYRSLEAVSPRAAGMIDGLDIAADLLDRMARDQRATDRQAERREAFRNAVAGAYGLPDDLLRTKRPPVGMDDGPRWQ